MSMIEIYLPAGGGAVFILDNNRIASPTTTIRWRLINGCSPIKHGGGKTSGIRMNNKENRLRGVIPYVSVVCGLRSFVVTPGSTLRVSIVGTPF